MKKKKIDLVTMTETPSNWWETDWYRQWETLAKEEYHGKKDGYWKCYYNEENQLTYRYVNM